MVLFVAKIAKNPLLPNKLRKKNIFVTIFVVNFGQALPKMTAPMLFYL